MVTQELIEYIKSQKQQAVNDETIKSALVNNNWSVEDINKAFIQIGNSDIESKQNLAQKEIVFSNVNKNIDEKHSKKTLLFFLSLILVLIILFTSFYFVFFRNERGKEMKKNTDSINIVVSSPTTYLSPASISLGKNDAIFVVQGYFTAVKNKDKSKARQFLSPDADKNVFKSTLDENFSGQSLYDETFSFNIFKSMLSEDGTTMFVEANISAKDYKMITTVILKKNESGNWLIIDIPPAVKNYFSEKISISDLVVGDSLKVLLSLYGSADLSITDIFGNQCGFITDLNKEVKCSDGVSYMSGTGEDGIRTQQIRISYMPGIWKLNIVGNKEEEYSFYTHLLGTKVWQDNTMNKSTKKGLNELFLLRYPKDTNKPLEVIPVRETN